MTRSPPAKAFDWHALGVRALSAVVLVPGVVWAVLEGGWLFLALIAGGAVLLSIEWGLMSSPRAPARVAAVLAGALFAALIAAGAGDVSAALLLLVFGAIVAALYARSLLVQPLDAAYGVFYLGWPCIVVVWLRNAEDGLAWTALVFAVAWASDIAAYLIGSLFKGPKFWPRVSPSKTWSGFLGGLTAGVLSAVAVAEVVDTGLDAGPAAIVGLVAALATMGGDLWESALKRRFGVKDSGHLIPGHGGLLDRVDGLMFAVVAVAACRVVADLGGFS